MLRSSQGPSGIRAFVIDASPFKTWFWEHDLLRRLTLEEVFENFLSEDWESKLWVLVYRHSPQVSVHPDELANYLSHTVELYRNLFITFRAQVLSTIENLTTCSLAGQEVIFSHWLDQQSIVLKLRPCRTLSLHPLST